MYHSVTFGSMNSFSDWHLVPEGRPLVVMPDRKEVIVDVPGGNGSLDLSESLTGYPVYQRRDGSIKFHVLDGYGDWHTRYNTIANYLHGKRRIMSLEDDPGWYYEGVFKVTWTSNNDGSGSEVEIGYVLDPLKTRTQTNIEENLNTSMNLGSLTANSTSTSISLIPGTQQTMPVIPTINVTSISGRLTLTFVNSELDISAREEIIGTTGRRELYSFPITNLSGTNHPTISAKTTSNGSCNFSITFRRASL